MDILYKEVREHSAVAPQRLPISHHEWVSDYLPRLQVMWLRASMPEQAVLVLTDPFDYAGSLVLSLLRSKQKFTQILADSRATVGYASRASVEETICLVYDSLSFEFTPPEKALLDQTRQPVLVFADGDVSVIDGRLPLDEALR